MFLLLQILVILKVKCVVLQYDSHPLSDFFEKKDDQIFGYLNFDSFLLQ
jgi:hypothetical protein